MSFDQEQNNDLIGRQQILNRTGEVIAYELLFRSADSRTRAEFSDVTHASASVILNTLSGFGLEQIIGKSRAFINLDIKMLMGDTIELLPKSRVVLEILESAKISPELIQRCSKLKESGFSIALDDHSFNPKYKELYQIVDIIKIDLIQTPIESLDEMVSHFRNFPVKLLAEKVETLEVYQKCYHHGFDFFQGYYLAKPTLMEKQRIEGTDSTLLKLAYQLLIDSEIDEIERIFRTSPGLTYKLFHLANSISLGFRNQIETVRHAITLLGRIRLKRWVKLELFVSDKNQGMENPLFDLPGSRYAVELAELFGRSFKNTTLDQFQKAGFSQDHLIEAVKKSQELQKSFA